MWPQKTNRLSRCEKFQPDQRRLDKAVRVAYEATLEHWAVGGRHSFKTKYKAGVRGVRIMWLTNGMIVADAFWILNWTGWCDQRWKDSIATWWKVCRGNLPIRSFQGGSGMKPFIYPSYVYSKTNFQSIPQVWHRILVQWWMHSRLHRIFVVTTSRSHHFPINVRRSERNKTLMQPLVVEHCRWCCKLQDSWTWRWVKRFLPYIAGQIWRSTSMCLGMIWPKNRTMVSLFANKYVVSHSCFLLSNHNFSYGGFEPRSSLCCFQLPVAHISRPWRPTCPATRRWDPLEALKVGRDFLGHRNFLLGISHSHSLFFGKRLRFHFFLLASKTSPNLPGYFICEAIIDDIAGRWHRSKASYWEATWNNQSSIKQLITCTNKW